MNNTRKVEFVVDCVQTTLRRWISHNFKQIPLSLICKSIRQKDILLNGAKTELSAVLYNGDKISIYSGLLNKKFVDLPEGNARQSHSVSFVNSKRFLAFMDQVKILHENEDFVVIDKPYGLPSQKGTDIDFSLTDVMQHLFPMQIYPVHRLDKNTTGVMIFGKKYDFAVKMSNLFSEQKVKKVYHAVVHGKMPKKSFQFESNMAMLYGNWGNKMIITEVLDEQNAYSVYDDDTLTSKYSNSDFNVIKEFYRDEKVFSLIEIHPHTGRKHQIRVHCDFFGNSIVGDVKYFSICKARLYGRECVCSLKFLGEGLSHTQCVIDCKPCRCSNRMLLHCNEIAFDEFCFRSECDLMQFI